MLTVVALPTLAQSVNGDAPETSPTPAPDEICEAVVEGGEIVEGIEYGSEVIECNSITEDIITPASVLPSFREIGVPEAQFPGTTLFSSSVIEVTPLTLGATSHLLHIVVDTHVPTKSSYRSAKIILLEDAPLHPNRSHTH